MEFRIFITIAILCFTIGYLLLLRKVNSYRDPILAKRCRVKLQHPLALEEMSDPTKTYYPLKVEPPHIIDIGHTGFYMKDSWIPDFKKDPQE